MTYIDEEEDDDDDDGVELLSELSDEGWQADIIDDDTAIRVSLRRGYPDRHFYESLVVGGRSCFRSAIRSCIPLTVDEIDCDIGEAFGKRQRKEEKRYGVWVDTLFRRQLFCRFRTRAHWRQKRRPLRIGSSESLEEHLEVCFFKVTAEV